MHLNITGVSTFAGAIDLNSDIDVDGHTNLDNLSVTGVSTFVGNVNTTFVGASSGTEFIRFKNGCWNNCFTCK